MLTKNYFKRNEKDLLFCRNEMKMLNTQTNNSLNMNVTIIFSHNITTYDNARVFITLINIRTVFNQ